MAQVSSAFAGAAESYELMMGRWARRLAGPFLEFSGLTDDGKILDAGCGTGALTAELLQRTKAAEVIGVDISESYVTYAREAVQSPRACFEVGDLTTLNYPDDSFNQVFSQLVLLFVPDFEKAIRELKRVTKPGGRLAATAWDISGGFVFNRIFWDVAAMLDPEAEKLRQRAFSRPLTRPNELAQAWIKAGMEEVRPGEITIRTEFLSFDDFWRPFAEGDGPIPAYVQQADDALRSKLEEALRRAYLGGDKDGPRSYVATAWVVSGLKPFEA
jgi:ubiquinone/menaquinone biosynthesis C-methylase UbiE